MARTGGNLESDARPSWLDDSIYPFSDHYMEIDGSRVHFIDEGSGPAIVFVHGNPTWSFLYRHIVLGLRDRFRCIAIDYPGFGLSTPADGYGFRPREHAAVVEKLIEALDLTDYTMMVHDWGGPIGLGVAARHAERVRALIVANTAVTVIGSNIFAILFSGLLGGPIGRVLIKRLNLFTTVVMRWVVKAKLSREELAAYSKPYPTPATREGIYVLPREILGSAAFLQEVVDGMPRLEGKPALLVWGLRDPVFGRAARRRQMEAYFRQSRMVLLHKAGHFVQEDAPDEIVAAIRKWWDVEVASDSSSG